MTAAAPTGDEPLETIYTLAAALDYVPFKTIPALRVWLWRHRTEFPRRYRRSRHPGGGPVVLRYLTASDLMAIQAATIVVKPPHEAAH